MFFVSLLTTLVRVVCIVCVLTGLLAIKKTRLRHVPARRTRVPRRYGETAVWLERLCNAMLDMFHTAMQAQQGRSSTPPHFPLARRAESVPAWADSTWACVLRLWNRSHAREACSAPPHTQGKKIPHSALRLPGRGVNGLDGGAVLAGRAHVPPSCDESESRQTWQKMWHAWSARTPLQAAGSLVNQEDRYGVWGSGSGDDASARHTRLTHTSYNKPEGNLPYAMYTNSHNRNHSASTHRGGDANTSTYTASPSTPMESAHADAKRATANPADVLPNRLLTALEERVNAALEDSGLATWAHFRIFALGESPPRITVIHLTSDVTTPFTTAAADTARHPVHSAATSHASYASSSSSSGPHNHNHNNNNNNNNHNNYSNYNTASVHDGVAHNAEGVASAAATDTLVGAHQNPADAIDGHRRHRGHEGGDHHRSHRRERAREQTIARPRGGEEAVEDDELTGERGATSTRRSVRRLTTATPTTARDGGSGGVKEGWLAAMTDWGDGALNRFSTWVMSSWAKTSIMPDISSAATERAYVWWRRDETHTDNDNDKDKEKVGTTRGIDHVRAQSPLRP